MNSSILLEYTLHSKNQQEIPCSGQTALQGISSYAQNLMLSIRAHGLASCPMTALSFNAPAVREELGLDDSHKLMFGIVFGYEDEEHDANKTRIGRADLADTITFAE